jgi:hypothetical protein
MSDQQGAIYVENPNPQKNETVPEVDSDGEKEVYFIILKPSEQQINFDNLEFLSDIKPENIFNKTIKKEDGSFLEEIVFKFKKPLKEKGKGKKKKASSSTTSECEIQYIDGDYTYIILFSNKDETFVYETELKKRNKYLPNIVPEDIDQTIIPLYNKLFIFSEALEKNKAIDKEEKLYKDSIILYEKRKKFSLLISLFLQIYTKNAKLCSKMLEIFYNINDKENYDKPKDLSKYLDEFKKIFKESDDIINNNKYDKVHFYGLLFCYLHNYDKENFPKTIKNFSEGNEDILYEILIKYHSHFTNSLEQDKNFYDRFIKYLLEKDYNSAIFKNILGYIDDIETLLFVINENIKTIYNKYEDLRNDPIKLSDDLILTKRNLKSEFTPFGQQDRESLDIINKKPPKTDKKNELNELDNIEELIRNIIEFSNEKKSLILFIKDTFWIKLLKEYDIPDWENINNCFKLRRLFREYNALINTLYPDEGKIQESKKKHKENISQIIKNEINRYYERDEYAFILNNNIKNFFKIKKGKLTNSEILGAITWFNPYFSKEKPDKERYKNYRETYIFDYINFGNIKEDFVKTFKQLGFEEIFEANIKDFINKITSKITDILTFGNIMKLLDANRLGEKKKDYYNLLKNKYDLIVKIEIQSLKEDKLDNAVTIVSEFVSKIFLDEQDTRFLEENISKLDDKIKKKIYYELIKTYNTKDYEKMKNYIFNIFLKKKEDIDSIIKLIDNLSEDDKKDFTTKLLENCKFDKKEYYSNDENKNINLLCGLNEAGKLKIIGQDNVHANTMMYTLDEIRLDLESGSISKNELEVFLNKTTTKALTNNLTNEEANDKIDKNKNEKDKKIIQKLGLIKLVIETYNPEDVFRKLDKIIGDIKGKVDDLNFIKEALSIFFRNKNREDIDKIVEIVKEIETNKISDLNLNEKRNKSIDKLLELKPKCDEINKVKNFLLFKEIFKISQGADQGEIFEVALKKLKDLKSSFENNSSNIETIFNDTNFVNIFKTIKEELGKKDESKSDLFIKQMIDYFDIKDDTKKEELKIIIKSKKYEMVVKSIDDFFINITGKRLALLPNNINLSEMDLKSLKRTLNKLISDKIYNYQDKSPFYKVYTSFYKKKEAIDFLLKKGKEDIKEFENSLKDKLDPTNRSISIKDINDTIECIKHFRAFKSLKNQEIINYIRDLYDPKDENITTIKIFESFSKKYESISELERKTGGDTFEEVYQIINDASLIFKLDSEDFRYKKNGENIKINIEELIKLKNKINIQPSKSSTKKRNDPYEIKCDKLLFFKDIISNVEVIYNKINILRTEGFNIPIIINISIKYKHDSHDSHVEYKLNDSKSSFSIIKDYLFMVKNDYENQLTSIYENEKYLRLLHGKFFRKVKLHQEGNCEILEIMRYILNNTNYTDTIKDGKIFNEPISEDLEEYKESTKKIFDCISNYIISLFKNNGLDLKTHYESMKIKSDKNNRGIYLKKCTNISTEEKILSIFMEKLERLPIAQNILICSKETTIEEIQSFFYRAILCDQNTLFVVEILDTFSNFQHNKMYGYIDKLLSYKFNKAKKENKDNNNMDKSRSKDYLDSCIIFVYKQLENEEAFKKELEKYIKTKEQKEVGDSNPKNLGILDDENNKKIEDLNISGIFNDSINIIKDADKLNKIKVISSDYCGLGKSFKIKKMLKEDQYYYHFPLGGMLTKKTIYEKLFNLFKKIKNDAKKRKEEKMSKEKKENKNEDVSKELSNEQYSEFNNIVIHLDLIESEETSLINEFLFSFLITKFYTNNEDIIYIPNNFDIYIEIPNSFEDYLEKYGILNAFNIENIVFGEVKKNEKRNIKNISMLELELDEDTKNYFKITIGKGTNTEIQQFIKENIGIERYSYHQVHTFIKLFISNFKVFDGKLTFSNSKGDNITKDCIKYFAKSTQYFTNSGFARLIMNYYSKQKDKKKR